MVTNSRVRVLIVGRVQALLDGVRKALSGTKELQDTREISRGVDALKDLKNFVPMLVLAMEPLPDLAISEFIAEARRICPSTRIILIADSPELPGFARSHRVGADGFISGRLLDRELPIILARYPTFAAAWGTRFSPWKEGYGEA